MDRTIVYPFEQIRSFDWAWMTRDMIRGQGNLAEILMGSNSTFASRFTATANTPANMSVNFDRGLIVSYVPMDPTDFGTLDADNTYVYQIGTADPQSLLFDNSDVAVGQSKWALVYCMFVQSDIIRSGDPDAGIEKFFNTADPTNPLFGLAGNGESAPSCRLAVAHLDVAYGAPATTGSELPPSAPAGAVGLYLINLTHTTIAIAQNDIKIAGPGVGANTGSYPPAPFAGGLYTQHHKGGPGQAPKIDLTSEVQNDLPFANLPVTNKAATTFKLAIIKRSATDPNGTTGALNDLVLEDDGTNPPVLWECDGAGGSVGTGTVWRQLSTGGGGGGGGSSAATAVTSFPATITQSGIYLCTLTADASIKLPPASGNFNITIVRADNLSTAVLTINRDNVSDFINGDPSSQLVKGRDAATFVSDGVHNYYSIGERFGA